MIAFRALLVAIFVAILGYTAAVAANHGLDLLPVFFGAIRERAWPGQFNIDFMSLLSLSALWLAWRHQFSAWGLIIAALGFFGGGLFLSFYLLLASIRAKGDVTLMLLGEGRAAALSTKS